MAPNVFGYCNPYCPSDHCAFTLANGGPSPNQWSMIASFPIRRFKTFNQCVNGCAQRVLMEPPVSISMSSLGADVGPARQEKFAESNTEGTKFGCAFGSGSVHR